MIRNAVFTCASALLIGLKAAEGLLEEKSSLPKNHLKFHFDPFQDQFIKVDLVSKKMHLFSIPIFYKDTRLFHFLQVFHVFAGKIE